MRLRIPLVPFAVSVHFERRALDPFRPRITVMGLLVITALLAVYMASVTLPARNQRIQYADQVVRENIALLLRAAEDERGREQEIRQRLTRCLAAAEKEEREATKWPEGSEKRDTHNHFPSRWVKAACNVPLPFADLAARKARALERRADELQKEQTQAGYGLARLEMLAKEAEMLPETPEWLRLELAAQLAELKSKVQSERQAELVKAFLAQSRGNQRAKASSGGL